MKFIFHTMLHLFLAVNVFSQNMAKTIADQNPQQSEEIRFKEYCDNNLGKSIGGGQCVVFPFVMLRDLGYDTRKSYENKFSAKQRKIQTGDLFFFSWRKGLKTYKHVGVVYELLDENTFIAAHQNVGGKLYVVKTTYSLDSHKFKFSRPVR